MENLTKDDVIRITLETSASTGTFTEEDLRTYLANNSGFADTARKLLTGEIAVKVLRPGKGWEEGSLRLRLEFTTNPE